MKKPKDGLARYIEQRGPEFKELVDAAQERLSAKRKKPLAWLVTYEYVDYLGTPYEGRSVVLNKRAAEEQRRLRVQMPYYRRVKIIPLYTGEG